MRASSIRFNATYATQRHLKDHTYVPKTHNEATVHLRVAWNLLTLPCYSPDASIHGSWCIRSFRLAIEKHIKINTHEGIEQPLWVGVRQLDWWRPLFRSNTLLADTLKLIYQPIVAGIILQQRGASGVSADFV